MTDPESTDTPTPLVLWTRRLVGPAALAIWIGALAAATVNVDRDEAAVAREIAETRLSKLPAAPPPVTPAGLDHRRLGGVMRTFHDNVTPPPRPPPPVQNLGAPPPEGQPPMPPGHRQ